MQMQYRFVVDFGTFSNRKLNFRIFSINCLF